MNARGVFVTTAIVLASISCTKSPKWQTIEWQGEGPAPLPSSFESESSKVKIDGGQIQFYRQEIAGVPVEGTFGKVVERRKDYDWASIRQVPDKDLPSLDKIQEALDSKGDTIKAARASLSTFPCPMAESALKDMQPEVQWLGRNWELTYNLECEDRSGQSWRISLNTKGKVLDISSLGSHFTTNSVVQVNASLYPAGPKSSALKMIKLAVSPQPNYLSASKITAVSDAGAKLTDLNSVASIKPGDIRFDLLQAYYYATEALNWASETFHFDSLPVKIRTHVGYPDNTNATFYYKREIRLGAGDGKVFSQLSLDPSIVDHETMHSVVDSLTGLPFQGQGGSLNEGLADSLTAAWLNDPHMGENAYLKGPYQRTLENNLRFNERTGGLYGDSLVLSGLIWELREKAGPETAQRLLTHLLSFLTPAGDFNAAQSLVQQWFASESSDNANYATVDEVLRRRGWL